MAEPNIPGWTTKGRELEVIFSSRDGYVWASWPDGDLSVKLGRHDVVAALMKDFLAQDALGLRLARHRPSAE